MGPEKRAFSCSRSHTFHTNTLLCTPAPPPSPSLRPHPRRSHLRRRPGWPVPAIVGVERLARHWVGCLAHKKVPREKAHENVIGVLLMVSIFRPALLCFALCKRMPSCEWSEGCNFTTWPYLATLPLRSPHNNPAPEKEAKDPTSFPYLRPPGLFVTPYLASLLSATAFWSGQVQEAPAGGHADSRFACSSF